MSKNGKKELDNQVIKWMSKWTDEWITNRSELIKATNKQTKKHLHTYIYTDKERKKIHLQRNAQTSVWQNIQASIRTPGAWCMRTLLWYQLSASFWFFLASLSYWARILLRVSARLDSWESTSTLMLESLIFCRSTSTSWEDQHNNMEFWLYTIYYTIHQSFHQLPSKM